MLIQRKNQKTREKFFFFTFFNFFGKTEKNTKKRTKIKETKNTLNEAYNKKDLKQKEVILIFRLVWIGLEFGTILGAYKILVRFDKFS